MTKQQISKRPDPVGRDWVILRRLVAGLVFADRSCAVLAFGAYFVIRP